MNTATSASRRLLTRYSSTCILSFCLLLGVFPLRSQTAFSSPLKSWTPFQTQDRKITLQVKNEKLGSVLEKIEKQSSFVFVYANDEINPLRKVTISIKEKNINDALSELLTPLNISYELVNDKIILKPVKPSVPLAGGSSGEEVKKDEPAATARPIEDITI